MPDPRAIPLALYVHIPWCERKCPYCDFNSHEHFHPSLEAPYVDALLEDLEQQADRVEGRPVSSVFFGGGTPSLFSATAIGRILEGISQRVNLDPNAEITLESNPGSAEAQRYRGYRDAGINRLSIGVQSFQDAALQRLGRIHSAEQARRAIGFAAEVFDRFNIDLMHGLPGQTSELAAADLSEGIDRCGGHLSWYQLTIEPNTAFWSRPPAIPVEDVLGDIQDAGEALLAAAGLSRYEVSAWAAPENACRHNLNYWQFGDYLGIGAGAHGKLTLPDGRIVRTQRSRIPRDYISSIESKRTLLEGQVALDALPEEFMLNALRLVAGVDHALFQRRTGLGLDLIEPHLSALRQRGLLVANPERIQATERGFQFLDTVVAEFVVDRR